MSRADGKAELATALANTGNRFRNVAYRMRDAAVAGAVSPAESCWLVFGATLSETIADVAEAVLLDVKAEIEEAAERERRYQARGI
jgi:hypothetical protein